MELLRQAVERTRAGEALALVTVAAVRGSAPRHVGTKMLVTAAGTTIGTIGGGRIEREATIAGAAVAAGAPARYISQHLVRDLAMCCGGSMELYIEPVEPSIAALEQVLDSWRRRERLLLITPLPASDASSDEHTGDKDAGQGRSFGKSTAPCEGSPSRTAYVKDGRLYEPIWPRERLVIFGAGHVARAVGPVAAGIDFEVTVCDDDQTGGLSRLQNAAPPWLSGVVSSFDIRDVEAELGPLGMGDYALMMAREHAIDQRILQRLLPAHGLEYLGLIGSAGKVGRFRKRLLAKNIVTPEEWSRLHAPVGYDIGAETPQEIAIAIAAELIMVRRRGAERARHGAPAFRRPGQEEPAITDLPQPTRGVS